MGIRLLLKIVLSTLFVALAIFTYSIGEQRGAFAGDNLLSDIAFNPLKSLELRREIADVSQPELKYSEDDTVRALALRAPLDPIPFELKTSRASADRQVDELGQFAQLALLRQPRSLTARLARFSHAAENLDAAIVIEEYSRLSQLRMIEASDLADALIGYFREDGDWQPLLDFLSETPPTGRLILLKLFASSVDAQALQEIVTLYPDTRAAYLSVLLSDNAYPSAYAAWLAFSKASEQERTEFPFNPRFKEHDAPAPFNWFLGTDFAEYREGGGLDLVYFGSGRPLLARQVVRAPPGDYTFSVSMSGQMNSGAGAIEWIVRCLPSDDVIASLITRVEQVDQLEEFALRISIPQQRCNYQRVDLYGVAGEFPQRSRIFIPSAQLIATDK